MNEHIRQGATASFAIGDVVCPDTTRTLEQVGPELMVSGTITMLSDHGTKESAFAVVSVPGIHSPLIVPVGQLQLKSTQELSVPNSVQTKEGLRTLGRHSA